MHNATSYTLVVHNAPNTFNTPSHKVSKTCVRSLNSAMTAHFPASSIQKPDSAFLQLVTFVKGLENKEANMSSQQPLSDGS